ncbi:Uncharacterised protein [Mycobacteroides abscessus subsp. abscessus]|nr:Uncharacterised protein [Mycobacteroides abscessus subsp. abscessus]
MPPTEEPREDEEDDHEGGDDGEEPRRDLVLRLHRDLPVEHRLVARLPRPAGGRAHRSTGDVAHRLSAGELDERRRDVGNLDETRLPGRGRGEQSRLLTGLEHHRRLHRRTVVGAVGDRGEDDRGGAFADAVGGVGGHPPGRGEDRSDPTVEVAQRIAVGGGVAEVDDRQLPGLGGGGGPRTDVVADRGPRLDAAGGVGGGDRGTGTERRDRRHRLGEPAERSIVVVAPSDLRVDVPVGDPAVERRLRHPALGTRFVGGAPARADREPAVDGAADRADAARCHRPDLRGLHHRPEVRRRLRVEVLELEAGGADEDRSAVAGARRGRAGVGRSGADRRRGARRRGLGCRPARGWCRCVGRLAGLGEADDEHGGGEEAEEDPDEPGAQQHGHRTDPFVSVPGVTLVPRSAVRPADPTRPAEARRSGPFSARSGTAPLRPRSAQRARR